MSKNLQAEITAKILEHLDRGVVPWRKPWKDYGSGAMPRNAISNRAYSGANVVLLWMQADAKGFASPKWLTFKQALEAGGHVRKGEKSAQIVYLGSITKDDDETGELRKVPFLKSYSVFNIAQCDGLDHLVDALPRGVNPDARDALAEEFIVSTGARITHGESRAYYSSRDDRVNLPAFEAFTGAEAYYSTAFHELTHWTGAEKRLNRTFGKRFGDQSYSAEELVAELGSAFLCAEFGFDNQTIENQAAYIDHGRRFLMEHEKAFVSAASAASKAVEYLRGAVLACEETMAA
jgi:antirestriction protein ArdC